MSLDTFCLQSFDATDAAFRTGCVLYNLLLGFRETVRRRAGFNGVYGPSAIWCLVGADLLPTPAPSGAFAVPREERTEFLTRLRTLCQGLPIAAQLEWDLTEATKRGRLHRRRRCDCPKCGERLTRNGLPISAVSYEYRHTASSPRVRQSVVGSGLQVD